MVRSQKMEDVWCPSYAQYLTIPRSIIQEMDEEWQDKLAELLEELDHRADWGPKEGCYWVELRDNEGKKKLYDDPLAEYRHGNPKAKELFEDVRKEEMIR